MLVHLLLKKNKQIYNMMKILFNNKVLVNLKLQLTNWLMKAVQSNTVNFRQNNVKLLSHQHFLELIN